MNNNHNHIGKFGFNYIPFIFYLIYEQSISIQIEYFVLLKKNLKKTLSLPDTKTFLDNKKKNADLKHVDLT